MAAAGARLSPGGSGPAPVRSAGGPAPPEPGAGRSGGARAGRVRTRRPHLPRDRRAAEAGNSADRHRMQRAAGASSHAASSAAAVPGPATAAPAPGGPSRHHRGRGRGGARRDPGRRVRRGLGWVTARGRGRGTGARYRLGVVPSGDADAVTVSPVRLGHQGLWFRVIIGAFPTPGDADSLLRALWRRGAVERPNGTILRTPHAFLVGREAAPEAAREIAEGLRRRGVAAYIVPAPGGSAQVLVGAFEAPDQARAADSLLRLTGLTATLAYRMGTRR